VGDPPLVAETLSTDPQSLLLLLVAALVAGMVDAIAGGGGLITLPALLSAGLPPHIALGTNKLAGTFGTVTASRAYIRKGIFKPRLWRVGIAATFVGALAGTLAVWMMSADALNRLVPALIIAVALYTALRRRPGFHASAPEVWPHPLASGGLGLGLGFYDGFAGPGAGAFWTTAGMAVLGLDIVHASGVARFMNFVSNVVSLAAFAALGLVDYTVGLTMGLALMLGAHIGAHSAIRFGAPFIRPVFVVVVLGITGRLMWQEWAG